MHAHELEGLLRAIEAFKGVEVTPISSLAPWHVILSGTVFLYGKPHFYETELNLQQFNGPQDVERLVRCLFAAFDKAEGGGPLDDLPGA